VQSNEFGRGQYVRSFVKRERTSGYLPAVFDVRFGSMWPALPPQLTLRPRKPMFASCQKRACLPTPHDIQSPPLAAQTEQAHIGAPMAHLRVTCLCGAIYEVIGNESPLKDQWPSKCVLCDRELFPPDKAIGQVRLVWRLDEDRE
jgi:hypothetical protein